MYIHQSNDNKYFIVKAETKFDVDTMLGLRGITSSTIARLHGDEVEMETVSGSEEETIMNVLFYYFVWKLANSLSKNSIRYIKNITSEILTSDRHFTCLNEKEYEDFIAIVRELDSAYISVLNE